MRCECEVEVVADIGQLRGALAGELARNAVGRRRGEQIASGRECEERDEQAHQRKKFTRLAAGSDTEIFSAKLATCLAERSMMLRGRGSAMRFTRSVMAAGENSSILQGHS